MKTYCLLNESMNQLPCVLGDNMNHRLLQEPGSPAAALREGPPVEAGRRQRLVVEQESWRFRSWLCLEVIVTVTDSVLMSWPRLLDFQGLVSNRFS